MEEIPTDFCFPLIISDHRWPSVRTVISVLPIHMLMVGTAFFDRAVQLNEPPVKNGLCSICKGAHRLCGKDRCPLMIKFYSQQKTMPLIDMVPAKVTIVMIERPIDNS